MKRLIAVALAWLLALAPIAALAQPPKPAYVTGSPTTGAIAKASGPQSLTTGDLSGDCTTSATLATVCLKTNGVSFGTFATQSYATPPAIGGTTPAAGSFTTLSATGNLTTNVTGSTQCLQANSSGVVSGAGSACGSGGGGGPFVAPTIVQTTTARSASGSSTSVTATFGASTTVGNVVVFFIVGFGGSAPMPGTLSMSGMQMLQGSNSNTIVSNQQVAVFYGYVASAATAYTVSISSPNGSINILAMEVSALRGMTLAVAAPAQATTTISTYLMAFNGPAVYLAAEVDGTFGPVTAHSPSAMTSVYDTTSSSGGHTGIFYSVPGANTGSNASITFTTSPTTPIVGLLQLFG